MCWPSLIRSRAERVETRIPEPAYVWCSAILRRNVCQFSGDCHCESIYCEVFTALIVRAVVFCFVTPCGLEGSHRNFGRTYLYIRVQDGGRILQFTPFLGLSSSVLIWTHRITNAYLTSTDPFCTSCAVPCFPMVLFPARRTQIYFISYGNECRHRQLVTQTATILVERR
jgi:hypothetical protein